MSKEQIADYLTFLIKGFSPSAYVEFKNDDLGTLFSVHVAEEEKGRLIGKGGETIQAIRHIVSLVGYANSIKASVKII